MYRLTQSGFFYTLKLVSWLLFLLGLIGWIGVITLQAAANDKVNNDKASITASAQAIESSQVTARAIGSEATFVITITSPSAGWLSVVPVSVTFENEYLAWVNGNPQPTTTDATGSYWTDLLADSGKIMPNDSISLAVTLRMVAATGALPDGVTQLRILAHDMKADPDGSGPKGDEISLADLTIVIPVAIKGGATPTSSPTATPIATAPATATATVTVTATPSITPTPILPAEPQGVTRSTEAVTIGWQTTDESNILGFNLFRNLASGEKQQVNDALIPAKHSGQPSGSEYVEVDDSFVLLQETHYALEIHLINAKVVTVAMGTLSATAIAVEETGVSLTNEGFTTSWQTMDETYMKGFDILRHDLPAPTTARSPRRVTIDPVYTKINDALILATHAGENSGTTYRFVDRTSRIGGGGGYGYKLRVLLRSGESTLVDLGLQQPVEIHVDVSASRINDTGMAIRWRTYDETIITGFNIRRVDAAEDEVLLNSKVISATFAGQASGNQYELIDTTLNFEQEYIYLIDTLLVDGSSIRYTQPVADSRSRLYLPVITR